MEVIKKIVELMKDKVLNNTAVATARRLVNANPALKEALDKETLESI